MTTTSDKRPDKLRYLREGYYAGNVLQDGSKGSSGRARVGVVGTGFISRNFLASLAYQDRFELGPVLTRRPLDRCPDYPAQERLTDSVDRLIAACDIVLECTGDPIFATDIIDKIMQAGLPVVTMNSEFHVTAGSRFVGRGALSEAHGDQPGCQAALLEEALELGFTPLVLGNMKGFQNLNPPLKDMEFWGKKNGISLPMVTSFTDGTKLQIEQALVANGCGAGIAREGLVGPVVDDLQEAGDLLAAEARKNGAAIVDYVLSPKLPHGIFLVAEHGADQHDALRYFKLGEGPNYVLVKPNIFVHLEITRTLARMIDGGPPLLNNSATPTISVATVAKRALKPGEKIAKGIGSFEVRGICVDIAEHQGHAPIGLVQDAIVSRPLAAGDILSLDDIEIPQSLALEAWRETEAGVVARAGA
ncbi:MAG: NAD(P)-dependent oxidoreductase [Alphaproteobacteria bacterium]